MKKSLLVMSLLFTLGLVFAQTTVFSDDFSTNQSTTWTTSGQIGSSAFSLSSSGVDWGARRNISPAQLELTNDASGTANVAGWVFAYTATSGFASPYNATLASNTGLVTWYINLRQIRADPAGFGSGNYGVAFILAGSSTTTNNSGTGYALALGQSLTTDPLRLVKYSAGISTSTNVITSNTTGLTDFGINYLSVKITYNPSSDVWEMFLRDDGTSAFLDPMSGTLTSQGTAVDNTYTLTSLGYMGGYWQGSTGANQTAYFDNLSVQVTPTIGNVPPSISNVSQTPAMDIVNTSTVSVSATITDSDGTIASAQLRWGTTSGTYGSTIGMSASGSIYTTITDIPAQATGTTVYYVIDATDDDSDTTTSAEYSYTVVAPASTTIPYTQDFSMGWADCYTYNVAGTKPWYIYASDNASCNGYGSTLEEHWLVLPAIDFDIYSYEAMTFNTIATYGTDDANNYLELCYSTDYFGLGDPTTATWTTIPYTAAIPSNPGVETASGVLDLSGISGTNVFLAFKYYSTDSPTRWELDDINIYLDEPLPVELSSFTATMTNDLNVQLTWITQSEDNMNGFYVRRATVNELGQTQLVSPLIQATNTSTMQTYTFVDNENLVDGTYYYWLEEVEMDGTVAYFGPITLAYSTNSTTPPVIPAETALKAVYPNPFNPTAVIPYTLAESRDVTIHIYNTRGQIIRSFNQGTQPANSYKIVWDGTDANGNALGTGVYYIKMLAGKDSFQQKAVLIK